ncbi:MAG: Flp pilus assembly complex ATPase component TadA [Planctomycetes bacterium]|nr:Flp pilus assembly complex ATPase component TadA [Planctomycetota bacterium]
MGKRKRQQKGSPRPKPARKKTARTPEQAGPTLEDTIEALRKAALVREEEVILPAEAGVEEPAALAAGLWDRLRRALFTRVRLGRREKALSEILREAHWVEPSELDRAEAEVAATGEPLGKLLVDRGLIGLETLNTARRIQEETGQPLWRTLVSLNYVLPEQLVGLLRQEVHLPFLDSKEVRLGEALVDLNLLTRQQLDSALRHRRKTSRPFGQLLLESGLITEQQLALGLARQYDVGMVDLADEPPQPEAFDQLPTELILENQALPIRYRAAGPGQAAQAELVVACGEPGRISYIRNLGVILGLTVKPVVAPRSQVEEAIAMALRDRGQAEEPPIEAKAPSPGEGGVGAGLAIEVTESPNIVELVDSVLTGAVGVRATDVHLDPQEEGLRVRYRIYGVLHDVLHLPQAAASGVIIRLKVMANLDIVERRLPQDAHLTITVDERPVNLRVATVPTDLGEKLVLRVLDEARIITALTELGLEPEQRDQVDEFLSKPYGMLLVVGPVGSGKTTTLYALLSQLNSPGKNLMSIEDPVEYRLAGANQLQVFRRVGFDFAAGLRAILRQDPDVIMVGEIRDDETARTSVRAALTGVFVMSTVHAPDAPATIGALYNFGIPGFLASGALIGVVAQRLVRKICPHCAVDYKPNAALLNQLGLPTKGKGRPKAFRRGEGCEHCFHTGYYGRTGIFEVLTMTEEIKDLIFRETTKEVLSQVARDLGMQTLRQSGLARVLDGTTTVQEFFRVIWT